MPKRQDNDSDESILRHGPNDPHYQPRQSYGITGTYGGFAQTGQEQDPERKSVKKTKTRKRLKPSKPQKGY